MSVGNRVKERVQVHVKYAFRADIALQSKRAKLERRTGWPGKNYVGKVNIVGYILSLGW